jgi:single-strand selective monofunctional uracil DNA glycosylase
VPDLSNELVAAARKLSVNVEHLNFNSPVAHVYNPLNYAWAAHEEYLRRFGNAPKRIVFLGMNPGPFGMVQTGVPFGEVAAVRDWLQIGAGIGSPKRQHLKRPVRGFDCSRSEVSGRRLWGLFMERFRSPDCFFTEHFVANYCPLAFLEKSGLNRTPDRLKPAEKRALFKVCDEHLRRVLEILRPEWLIGIGGFAAERGRLISEETKMRVGQILHPSPASPAANRGWAQRVTKQLAALRVWK